MKIGLICAIPQEARHIQTDMQIVNKVTALKNTFYQGQFLGHEIVLVVSGMGKVSSALCTQYLIDHFDVDLILFTGIAGRVDPNLHIGDTIIGTELLYHDVDRKGEGIDEDVPHALFRKHFQTDPKLLEQVTAGLAELELPLADVLARVRQGRPLTITRGRILTGDQVITAQAKVAELGTRYQAACVEMEGASIAQACYMNDTPFLIIRTISDLADEEAMQIIQQTMLEVVQVNYQILQAILKSLQL